MKFRYADAKSQLRKQEAEIQRLQQRIAELEGLVKKADYLLQDARPADASWIAYRQKWFELNEERVK